MKLLCVDVDGVVITGRAGDGAHWATDLPSVFGITRPQLRDAFFKPHWQDIVTGRKPLRPCLDEALATIPNAPSADDLIAFWFSTDSAVNQPLVEALGTLHHAGLRMVLATNQEAQRSAYLWDVIGLRDHFDAIYSSGDLGVTKPDPAFFEAIAQREGTAPADIAFLDDSTENCAAAQAAGWSVGHVAVPQDALGHLSDWSKLTSQK